MKTKPYDKYDKKTFRLMYILNRLVSKKPLKTQELADEFNVTQRTVQRDLGLLEALRYPIEKDRDGYRFEQGFSLSKVIISPEERILLSLFNRLSQKLGHPFFQIFRKFLNKVLLFSDKEKVLLEKKEFRQKKKELKQRLDFVSEFLGKEPLKAKYRKKTDLFINRIKKRIETLRTKEKLEINIAESLIAQDRQPILAIEVPCSHFKDTPGLIDDLERFEKISFKLCPVIHKSVLKKTRPALKMRLEVEFYTKVIDISLRKEDISCFDGFAEYLGFRDSQKSLSYEVSSIDGSVSDSQAKLYWIKKLR